MSELEEAQKKLQKIKDEMRKEKWDKRINWIQRHKQKIVFGVIFLMLGYIILNQTTYIDKDQYFYIGEIKDMGIRWEGGSTKTAVVWISFNDSNKIDFQRYNYNVYERVEDFSYKYIGCKVIVTYEKSPFDNTLLFIMEL